jgi:hypothetical protein
VAITAQVGLNRIYMESYQIVDLVSTRRFGIPQLSGFGSARQRAVPPRKTNTPEEAREAVIERAQNGEALTSTHAVADAGFAHLAEGDFLRVSHDEMVKPGFICTTFLSTQLSTRSAQCCINFVRGPISARGPCRL